MNMLYKRHNYLDKNVTNLISQEIYEYDLQSAGFNIIKYFKLVSDEKIKDLENSSKKKRQIKIGLMMRPKKNKILSEKINQGFEDARKLFFEANELKEEEVLSIKKDAIITLRPCKYTTFGNLNFVVKNYYSSYFYINGLEFYYNSKKGIDVKGIGEKSKLHEEYMLDFMYQYIKLLETSSREKAIEFILKFIYYYKRKHLDIGYYRELNQLSMFKSTIHMLDDCLYFETFGDYDKIDISYNYMNIIVPLMQILI